MTECNVQVRKIAVEVRISCQMFPVIVSKSRSGNAKENGDNDENRSRRCDHADSRVSFDKCIVGHSSSPIDDNGGRISVEATSGSAHRTFSNAGKPDSST